MEYLNFSLNVRATLNENQILSNYLIVLPPIRTHRTSQLITDKLSHLLDARVRRDEVEVRQLEVLELAAGAATTHQLPEDQAQGVNVGTLPRVELSKVI